MKINDKALAHFFSSNSPVDREGWLVKRGEVNKSFQKRWCVLKGNLLFYCEKPGDREPIGVIILEGCTVELAEEETEKEKVFAFKIVFHGDGKSTGRVYILGSKSMPDLEAWMKLIACASYDYMKLMIVELEHQLQELEQRDKLQNQDNCPPVVPPRQNRTNPFNSSNILTKKRKNWMDLHNNIGQKILADRQNWAKRVSSLGAEKTTVTMEEDNLLVVF